MITLRKIDYMGQLIVGSLMLLSIPILFIYGFLVGLFIMGCWQLISAALNTNAFIHTGHRKQIWIYWKCCFVDFVVFALCWLAAESFPAGVSQVIPWIVLTGGAAIAVYYLKIYNNLIHFIALRNELDGLTKSKH